MGKYLGFSSEEEYDASIERDVSSDIIETPDEFGLRKYRDMLADPESSKFIYGESYIRLISYYENCYPNEKKPLVASVDKKGS